MKSLKIVLLLFLVFSASACSLNLSGKTAEKDSPVVELPINPDFSKEDKIIEWKKISLAFPEGMDHFEKNFFFNLPEDWEYFIDDNNQLIIRTKDTIKLIEEEQLFPSYANNIVVKYYKSVEDINIIDVNSKSQAVLKNLSDIFISSASDLSKPWEFIANRYVGNYKAYEFINGGYATNYAIIVATDLGTYEFQFLRAADKESLSDIEKEILDSIDFPELIYEF